LHPERRILSHELAEAHSQFLLVGLGFRFDGERDDRLRKSIASRTTGRFSSQRVSPVVTLRSPTAAAISPAYTSLMSSRLFACIFSNRPMRSVFCLVVLYTDEPEVMTPEYTRKNVSWPTNGSVMILKASAENGASSAAGRSTR